MPSRNKPDLKGIQPSGSEDKQHTSVNRFAGVVSPCCKKCRLLPDNTCEGCGRTLTEIATWAMLSEDQRHAVWSRLEAKKAVLNDSSEI